MPYCGSLPTVATWLLNLVFLVCMLRTSDVSLDEMDLKDFESVPPVSSRDSAQDVWSVETSCLFSFLRHGTSLALRDERRDPCPTRGDWLKNTGASDGKFHLPSVFPLSYKTLGFYVLENIHGKTITYSSVMSNVESSSQPATQHVVWNLLYIKPSIKSCWKIPRKRAVVSDEGKIQHRTHQLPLTKQSAAGNKSTRRDEGCHCAELHLRTSTLRFYAWTLFG